MPVKEKLQRSHSKFLSQFPSINSRLFKFGTKEMKERNELQSSYLYYILGI